MTLPSRIWDVAKDHAQAGPRAKQSDVALVASCVAGTALVVGATAFLVWVRVSQVETGYAIQQLRQDETRLRNEKSALQVEVASLLRPERLAALAKSELDLEAPDATRTFRLDALKTVAAMKDAR